MCGGKKLDLFNINLCKNGRTRHPQASRGVLSVLRVYTRAHCTWNWLLRLDKNVQAKFATEIGNARAMVFLLSLEPIRAWFTAKTKSTNENPDGLCRLENCAVVGCETVSFFWCASCGASLTCVEHFLAAHTPDCLNFC